MAAEVAAAAAAAAAITSALGALAELHRGDFVQGLFKGTDGDKSWFWGFGKVPPSEEESKDVKLLAHDTQTFKKSWEFINLLGHSEQKSFSARPGIFLLLNKAHRFIFSSPTSFIS